MLAAAHELSYIPSESGRVLSTRTRRRIAVVAEELTNPFYPELLEPLRQRLADHDYRTVLVADRGSDPVRLEALADGSYDGVVLCTVSRRSTLPRDLTERGVPHVLVNRTLDHPESSSCAFDNIGGARALGRLLHGLGHERVGAIQGPTEYSTGRDRAVGLSQALRAAGIRIRRQHVRRVAYTYEDGFRAATDVLRAPEPPTALFCANDVVAIGALAAARATGLRVPEELTVVGFDDIPMAGWGMVALTTMRCDVRALAEAAIDLLLESLQGRPARQVTVPTVLVARASHGPAPARR